MSEKDDQQGKKDERQVNFRISNEGFQLLEHYCQKFDMTKSQILRMSFQDWCKWMDKQKNLTFEN